MSADYLRWKAIDLLARALPRRAGYALAGLISRVMYATDPEGRTAVSANLAHILSSRGRQPSAGELERLGRETYRNFGRYLIEFFKLREMTLKELGALATIENGRYLDEAARKGRGVITVSGHVCNWEVAGMAIRALGYRPHGVYFPMKDPRTAALFEERRRGRGLRMIPFGRAAAAVLRLLREGAFIALAIDADFSTNDDLMDFFGSPARLPSGPARISVKMGSPIVPCFALRRPDGTFCVRFHPPVDPEVEGSVEAVRERLRDVLEKEIGEHPTQWFVFVDFWDAAENRRLALEGVG